MSRIAAILPAAGMGTRMGAETPKQFLELDGTPIVILSLRRIAACPQVTDIIVATRADEVARLEERIKQEKFKQAVRVVKGGDSRQGSVAAALREVANDTEIVLVHDAVRPFVTPEQVARVIEEARRCEAAILGIPAMDTVKEVKRSEEHTSELQSRLHLVCRLLLEKKKNNSKLIPALSSNYGSHVVTVARIAS